MPAESKKLSSTLDYTLVSNKYTRQTRMQLHIIVKVSKNYSHSMVAGGLELISYTTRLTPFTLLIISLDIFARKS